MSVRTLIILIILILSYLFTHQVTVPFSVVSYKLYKAENEQADTGVKADYNKIIKESNYPFKEWAYVKGSIFFLSIISAVSLIVTTIITPLALFFLIKSFKEDRKKEYICTQQET